MSLFLCVLAIGLVLGLVKLVRCMGIRRRSDVNAASAVSSLHKNLSPNQHQKTYTQQFPIMWNTSSSGTNSTIYLTSSTNTSSGVVSEYGFPDWVEVGALVIDKDGNVWEIQCEYTAPRDRVEVGIIQVINIDTDEEREFCIEDNDVEQY